MTPASSHERRERQLLLPAWSIPNHLTDDEFRATDGAKYAALMGFESVIWVAKSDSCGIMTEEET
jgi:hypothetical protein